MTKDIRDLKTNQLIDLFKRIAKEKGYTIYNAENGRGLNLNIWAIRKENKEAGKFDDLEVVFYENANDGWTIEFYDCTTDPGTHYLLNPLSKYGTAIVQPNQYKGVWELGYHKDRKNHPALVQVKPISVIRDDNEDRLLNYDKLYGDGNYLVNTTPTKYGEISDYFYGGVLAFTVETGYFGINNHRASKNRIIRTIGKYSAGCIVQNNYNRYMGNFIPLIERASKAWGNSFTFTLIRERDLNIGKYNAEIS